MIFWRSCCPLLIRPFTVSKAVSLMLQKKKKKKKIRYCENEQRNEAETNIKFKHKVRIVEPISHLDDDLD